MNTTQPIPTWPFWVAAAGVFQFFVLTGLGMLFYTGGTLVEPELDHYSFTLNFFSDMGRWNTFTGVPNQPAFTLFTIAVMGAGASTLLFSASAYRLFEDAVSRKWAKVAGVFGVLAGVCYIIVGLTPWDFFFDAHVLAVKSGFPFFLVFTILFAFLIYRTKEYPRFYLWAIIIFIFILICYLYILFFYPTSKTDPEIIRVHVIAQKILLYSQMATMLIESYGAWRYAKVA